MAVSKMFKTNVLAYSTMKERLIEEIHRAGIIEISEVDRESIGEYISPEEGKGTSDINESLQEINKLVDDLSFSTNFISAYLPKKYKKKNKNAFISEKDAVKLAKDFKYNIVEKIKRYSHDIQQINSEKESIKSRIEELNPWKSIKIDFNELNFENVKVLFCITSTRNFDKLNSEIGEIDFSTINVITETKDNIYFTIIYENEKESEINNILKNMPVNLVDFQDVKEDIHKTIGEYKSKIKELDKKFLDITDELKEFSDEYFNMLIALDYWSMIYERELIKKKFISTESSFLLTGWIREKDIPKLKQIENKYKEIDISITPPEKEDVPPVALENSGIVRPFEVVTKLFGVPGKGEPDPTPLLSPFFALFFAICLTDAGYGLILILLGFIILKKSKGNIGTEQLMKILIIGGSITVLVGAVTGGWFGIDFDSLPPTFKAIKTFRDKLTLLDPLKSPLTLFIITLSLGILQLLTGLVVKIVLLLKDKEYYEAFSSPLPNFLILGGTVLAAVLKNSIYWLFPFVGAVIMLFFSSRSKNIIMRLVKGAYSLYGITGLFGDVISYSRLFALALSTGVIALVINVIVGILYKMIISVPYIGIPVGILFLFIGLIFGHIFNVLINSLGGFIHTTRLQFVEYFGKFYEGTGTEFKPFKQEFKYIR